MFYRNRELTNSQTQTIMTSSAIFMAAHGIVLLFAPEIILNLFDLNFSPDALLSVQFFGGALIAFGNMNWVGRNSVLGGIYGRAIVTGNFTYTIIAFLTGLRIRLNGFGNAYFWIEVFIYFVFAVAFGMILFGTPAKGSTTT